MSQIKLKVLSVKYLSNGAVCVFVCVCVCVHVCVLGLIFFFFILQRVPS